MRAAALVLAGFAALSAAEAPKIDLTLKDATGQKVRLRDLRGKPVVVNFWATWCVPCNSEMPMLVDFEKQYAARGVQFIAASLDEDKTKAKIPGFVAKYKVDFPVWYGATADDLDHLKLGEAVPATLFLDPDGHAAARILGQARAEEVKERLEWLTGDRTSAPPQAVVKHLEK